VQTFFENRLKFDRIMAMSLWPRFFGPPCMSNIALIDVILCPYEAKLLKIKLCNVNTGCLRCMHVILSLSPWQTTQVLRPRNSYEKLARETPFVCHAFSHEFFLVRETSSELVTALFRPRNLESRDWNPAASLVSRLCLQMKLYLRLYIL